MVIGAGLPRTGTTSLRAALERLLGSPSYHMYNVIMGNAVEWDHWLKAKEGKLTKEEWISFLEGRGFQSGCDYPISFYYK